MAQGKASVDKQRERDEIFRELFETINDAVFVHRVGKDGVPGRFVEVNDVACRRLGYTRDELLGLTPADIADAGHQARLEKSRNHLLANGATRFETVHVAKDGTRIPVESNVRMFAHQGQTAALSISRDITHRKRAEEALTRNRDRFESILSNIQCITYRCALDRDWTMNYISPHVDQLTGYPPADFIDNAVRTYESIIHPEDTGYVCRSINEAVASGQSWEIEYRIRHKAGGYLWVYEKGRCVIGPDGRVAYLYGFVVNITERKQGEEQLRAAHARILDIVEFLPDPTFVIDKAHRVIAWNRAIEAMTKRTKAEMIGKGGYAYAEPFYGKPRPMLLDRVNDENAALAEHYDCVRRDQGRVTVEVFLPILNGGKGAYVLASAAPLLDRRGNAVGAIETIRDISERKLAEQERNRLNTTLAAKNAELEQLVYVASHDLRSPLVNIDGYSKELGYTLEALRGILDETPEAAPLLSACAPLLDREIPEAMRFIRTSAAKMDALLTGLLRLSRSGRAALAIEPIDMNRLMAKVIDAVEFQIKAAGVRLDVAGLPPCRGDAVQVNQVFSNLVGNAIKYRDPDRPCIIRIAGQAEKAVSVYCVEDNGIGIAPEHLDKIFEIFHRLDPACGDGDGLGLTIVKRILDRLDGSMRVASKPGAGSRFYVSLPA